jgi:hypothetical protein
MSSSSDFELIHGQLHVTKDASKPEALGRGPATIRGASYLQGPNQLGNDRTFPNIWATTMIGPLNNSDSPTPSIPGSLNACGPVNNSPYSLAVYGDAAIFDNCDVNLDIVAGRNVSAGRNITARGNVKSQCGKHTLSAKKNFDIQHPSKEGWRLRHTCIEGPSNDVYIKGRIRNITEISLPNYWKDFVDIQSMVIMLQPIGAHQDIIIKRWDENKVYLQSKGGMPIDCFYHIIAERIDGEKLISEYKGETPADYPGDNQEYSVSGYHYDTKEG